MDLRLRQHTIQLGATHGAAATQPGDGGAMSSELYLAVCGGKKEEAMALLRQLHHGGSAADDRAAGIHLVSAKRNNVLHLAAEHGRDELIHHLVGFGGKSLLSAQNSALDTPLQCAARAGHCKAVSALVQLALDYGDESALWCKNAAGDTALHLAARLGHGVAVEAMVSAASGLASEVNHAGVSPLYLAVMSRSVRAVRAITTRCRDASAAGPSSQNALHAAVFQGSEMVSLLLEWKPCGPSLASQADDTGSTPLHFASSDGDRSVVGAILSATPPCAVRVRDSGGLSALHVAAGMGHAHVAMALMDACPDAAELQDDSGGTFLHAAARGGHSEVVRLAIKKPMLGGGGLLNTQDGDGNTPLHLAVAAREPAIAEALLWTGQVRADVTNNDGHTPLDLAARSTDFYSMVSLVVTLTAFGAQFRPQRRDHVQRWDSRNITKAIEKTSDSLAVVAVLVAGVAFTAANNLPGSYEQEGNTNGMAVLRRKTIFKCFLILDGVALVTSILAVVLLVYGKASRSARSWKSFAAALHCIWASLISMLLAFYAAIAAVTSTTGVYDIRVFVVNLVLVVLFIVLSAFVSPPVSHLIMCKFLWQCGFRGRQGGVVRRRISQQYPVVGAFVFNLLLFRAAHYVILFAGFIIVSTLRGGSDVR
ncbi:ankyrin repeat-containing protein At2g01680-like [Triticum dicoccoides]|uniref:ankyrin repeat-containing protein At2g01680-like n=1 Tax=Triticum dicoccoides TaxID=85692 RepID=UPI00188E10A8|nr:ankyrin repeat-containing protein At2g01680-like [Triticum dicoccoides]